VGSVRSKLLGERPQRLGANFLALHGHGDFGHACPKMPVLLDEGTGVSGLAAHEGGNEDVVFLLHLAGEALGEFSPEGGQSIAIPCLDGFQRGGQGSLDAPMAGGATVA